MIAILLSIVILSVNMNSAFAEIDKYKSCLSCVTDNLREEQVTAFLTLLENRKIDSVNDFCNLVAETPDNNQEFNQIHELLIVIPNISESQINNILNCLQSNAFI